MRYSPQQQPVYVVQQIPPDVEGAAMTALLLEMIFGFFGLLGVGHIYADCIVLGIVLMVVWWLYVAIAVVISSITFGIAACIFGPLYIVVPVISGIYARTHVLKQGKTGSWSSVALVAGGGCLLIIVAIVLVLVAVFVVAYLGSLGY